MPSLNAYTEKDVIFPALDWSTHESRLPMAGCLGSPFAFLSFALPSSAFAQDTGIGFLYIDQPEVTVGSTQQIAIISNDEADLVGATLRYSVYDRKHGSRPLS